MKKYPVKREFIDKNTSVYYAAESVYETVDADRAKYLQERGYIGEAEKSRGKGTEVKSTGDGAVNEPSEA
ncbi:hypothetical protein EDM59_01560 [Brevibacillus nitrificans]|uniref:Uncharacterized protein n=1 Tax=Brevibacillus nitrificans TaxID=651560 RepID=A0A3M8DRS5_9BACL|nr:hypothetical protein [Brevibacillus nitrificans]RNB90161.1 hypothetical protein EDM59_01560 [Brevibacillus nitrificans]